MAQQLPKNWIETELDKIFHLYYGKGLPVNSFTDEGYNVYGANGIIGKYKNYHFEKHKVIISCRGAASGAIHKTKPKSFVTSNSIILDEISSKYLNLDFAKYAMINADKESVITGTAQPQITVKLLKDLKFPLAPLAEQQRIVEKLENLYVRLDKIKISLKNLISIKEKFIYSCLVSSVSKEFYTRKKIGEFLEEGTERIGDEWMNCRKVGVSAKKGIIDLSTGQKKTFEKYKVVRPGDFIYNTMRVNIGSIAIYNGVENAITSPDYVVFRVERYLSPELLLGFLKSDQGLLEIGANTKGSVRARLYFKSLSEIRMPVSDDKTQILAEKFLHEFSKSIKKLKKLSKTQLDNLMQSILHKAFKGELVPQLESDGDAKDLLEKIKNSEINNPKDNKALQKEKPVKSNLVRKKLKTSPKKVQALKNKDHENRLEVITYLKNNFGLKKFNFNDIKIPGNYSYDEFRLILFDLLDQKSNSDYPTLETGYDKKDLFFKINKQ